MASKNQLRTNTRQKITLSLTKETLQKVRVLAAHRATSISRLLEDQIESLAGQEERAQRQALALLDQGFHLGGVIRTRRDEWHIRYEPAKGALDELWNHRTGRAEHAAGSAEF